MSGIPEKFTTELINKIPFWVQAGKSREEMAALVGVTVEVFSVTCSRKGISLKQASYPSGSHPVFMPISPETWERLQHEGAKRNLRGDQLGAYMLDLIAREDMFRAVIDDGK